MAIYLVGFEGAFVGQKWYVFVKTTLTTHIACHYDSLMRMGLSRIPVIVAIDIGVKTCDFVVQVARRSSPVYNMLTALLC
jgi:hypothetical protein